MLYKNESEFYSEYEIIAGVDEAGRGPLAGPVVAAAVILDKKREIDGLDDSKKLSAKRREFLYDQIIQRTIDWQVSVISAEEIDQINILQASLKAMQIAVNELKIKPDFCLIDGDKTPKAIAEFSTACIKGDAQFASIAAASIIAKVTRDRIMLQLHGKYPQYDFAAHKGYPTQKHLAAIEKFGILPCHRKTYKPIQQLTIHFK